MPHRFPSEDWTTAYRDAVNKNDAYRKAARPWTFGSVAMVINAEPGIGIEDDTGMILDVHREPLVGGIERRALGHRPGDQNALVLEPEVVVAARRCVQLHDEARTGRHRRAERFGRGAGPALLAITP